MDPSVGQGNNHGFASQDLFSVAVKLHAFGLLCDLSGFVHECVAGGIGCDNITQPQHGPKEVVRIGVVCRIP